MNTKQLKALRNLIDYTETVVRYPLTVFDDFKILREYLKQKEAKSNSIDGKCKVRKKLLNLKSSLFVESKNYFGNTYALYSKKKFVLSPMLKDNEEVLAMFSYTAI